MLGDKIVVKPHHTKAAQGVFKRIKENIFSSPPEKRYAITVSGESGCGKSEIGSEILRLFNEKGARGLIFHQDDYFIYPPGTNDKKREEDINNVGMGEVKMDLLDCDIEKAKKGNKNIQKPLIDYNKNIVISEEYDASAMKIIVAEGTYTAALKNADIRVFIDRDYRDTLEHRRERGRDALNDYTKQILEIEHKIISAHKKDADIIIGKDYSVG
ncbi:MAG: hypothetical protein PF545_07185 [Elusimicrobia bacterium]|jgi:uridine kinase|nr:hypothetical protein [Elusimicrobiota bacterium]